MLGLIAAGLFSWLADEEREGVPANDPAVRTPDSALDQRPPRSPAIGGSERLFPTGALWFFFLAMSFCFSLRDFAGSAMATSASLFLQNAHGFSPKLTGLALSGIFLMQR